MKCGLARVLIFVLLLQAATALLPTTKAAGAGATSFHSAALQNARQWADAPVVPGRLCPTSSILGEYVRRHKLRTPPSDFNNGGGVGNAWMQRNWEPHLRCVGELRLGQAGDGGKHVCDPECLLERNSCLVYSFGSNNDFGFESTVLSYGCKIHVFDHTGASSYYAWSLHTLSRSLLLACVFPVASPTPPEGVTFHSIGIAAAGRETEQLKSFETLSKELGHANNTIIDILKIDVEGAEFDVFLDGVTLRTMRKSVRQILVEVHYKIEERAVALARAFTDAGFYVFSKEPNIQYSNGDCVEFSLLNIKLV